MSRISLPTLGVVLAVAAAPAAGQEVRGTPLDATSRAAIPGALVRLEHADGRDVTRP